MMRDKSIREQVLSTLAKLKKKEQLNLAPFSSYVAGPQTRVS